MNKRNRYLEDKYDAPGQKINIIVLTKCLSYKNAGKCDIDNVEKHNKLSVVTTSMMCSKGPSFLVNQFGVYKINLNFTTLHSKENDNIRK